MRLKFLTISKVIVLTSVIVMAAGAFVPQTAYAITCGAAGFTDIGAGVCRGYLTSGTTWSIPTDWTNTDTIEVIGGGGGGGSSVDLGAPGAGGGAGAYSKTTNITLTPGGTAYISIGTGGGSGVAGGDTWFNSTNAAPASSATGALAKGGASGNVTLSFTAAGGAAGSGIGSTKFSGGAGGSGDTCGVGGGGGGGGAASSAADGNAGSTQSDCFTGGDGGSGSGSGGGGGGAGSRGGAAGVGSAGTNWDGSHGSGGGGGGGYGDEAGCTSNVGGDAGNYGGGGGGAGYDNCNGVAGGSGKQGLVVITYTAQSATAPTVTTQAVSSITSSTATGNGNVTSDGGATITERGVVWNTSINPTTANSKATAAGTTGAYTASITGLVANTLYHVRAYAINAQGTSYGSDVTFAASATRNLTINKAVSVKGNVTVVSNLTKGSGTFVIDDPSDPADKLLYHSFVESPDALNEYTGTAIIGKNGEAVVKLPDYFEALNGDYQYFVRPLDTPMGNLYIKQEVNNNQFVIAGGTPGGEVSWMVTGVRHDPYILAHPIIVEVEKGPDQLVDKGEYLFSGYASQCSTLFGCVLNFFKQWL